MKPHTPKVVLLVRFKTNLTAEEAAEVMERRAPEFKALAGLQQKYYLRDPASGDLAGLYLWDSTESFEAYHESELRRSIATAYEVDGQPRIEVYRVVKTLRESDA